MTVGKFDKLIGGRIVVRSAVEERLLREYGSVLVAEGVQLPDRLVFHDDKKAEEFRRGLDVTTFELGGLQLELQRPATESLLDAARRAETEGLSITPRGPDSAGRTFAKTVALWSSRVLPALDHWTSVGKLSEEEADRIRCLSPAEQVPVIFELEKAGIYFSKDLSKSIIYSVAPPGASQHLFFLAFDVAEFGDENVREILARHGWYQTVISDLPHFTYLGAREEDLHDRGLLCVERDGFRFWVPDL